MTKAEQIEQELQALRSEGGLLMPESVVDWAREHPESALHSQFEWDDSEAAKEYRLYQARRVIAVYVVSEDGERKFVSLSIDRAQDGGYRDVREVIANEELRKVLVRDALSEFKRVRAKYEHIRELASIYAEIDKAEREHAPELKQDAA